MRLKGRFAPPGDKSISHRAVLFSLLAGGSCRVENLATGADLKSSLAAATLLAGEADAPRQEGQAVLLTGKAGDLVRRATVDCGNSGTTLRLLMGLLAGVPEGDYTLDGDWSLRRRPMERVAGPLREMGAQVTTTDGTPPVEVRGGGLKGISYKLPVASAQLATALLLAGLSAKGATELTEPAASRDHTQRMLAAWGAEVERDGLSTRLQPGPITLPQRLRVPGDPSSAAFFLTAAALMPGSEVKAEGVLLNPTRIGFLEILERMGAYVLVEQQGSDPEPWGDVTVRHSPDLEGVRVRAGEIPGLVDEVPILALAASQARGETVFRQVGELRVKESDRAQAIVEQLGAMGAAVRLDGDDLVVTGPTPLKPAAGLDAGGDHRIAMSLRLAACLAGAPELPVAGSASAAISYPEFDSTLQELAG